MSSRAVEGGPPRQLVNPVLAAGALDLAVQLAGCLLSAGMSANDVVVVALRITRTFGLRRVHFDVTYTSIAASYYPGPGVPPITCIRTVRPDVIDYTQVRALDQLSTDIEHGLRLSDAAAAFLAIAQPAVAIPNGCRCWGMPGSALGRCCCSPSPGRFCSSL